MERGYKNVMRQTFLVYPKPTQASGEGCKEGGGEGAGECGQECNFICSAQKSSFFNMHEQDIRQILNFYLQLLRKLINKNKSFYSF